MKLSVPFLLATAIAFTCSKPSFSDESKFEYAELRDCYGAIDGSGKFVIPPKYRYLHDCIKGFLTASVYSEHEEKRDERFKGHCGMIDRHGHFVIPPIYQYFHRDEIGYVLADDQNGRQFVLNSKGETLAKFGPYTGGRMFGGRRLSFGDYWGHYSLVSMSGKVIINKSLDNVFPLGNKRALAMVGGHYSLPVET